VYPKSQRLKIAEFTKITPNHAQFRSVLFYRMSPLLLLFFDDYL